MNIPFEPTMIKGLEIRNRFVRSATADHAADEKGRVSDTIAIYKALAEGGTGLIITKGEADFISMTRPLIREPGLIKDWMRGDRHRAACISCNGCLQEIRSGNPLRCTKKTG